MVGINGSEGLVLLLLAVLLLGNRMPEYARTLAGWVRQLRGMTEDAKQRLKSEVPEIEDLDWRRMDPRQYDPRRIIREALTEEEETPQPPASTDPNIPAGYTPPAPVRKFVALEPGTPAPFDTEAT